MGVPDASSVYIVAVVASAFLVGTAGAVAAALGAFLLYNYLFTDPVGTFVVADPGDWLELALLLFVAIVVGQLVALLRSRAEVARAREHEARALFRLSRALATRDSTLAVLPQVAGILREESRADRVWVAIGLGRCDRAGRGRYGRRSAAGAAIDGQRHGADIERRAGRMDPGPSPRPASEERRP